MNSPTNFCVGNLNEKDAWDLFEKVAGACIEQFGLQPIASEVAKRCGGLPVAIVTIAKALKDKQVHAWRNVLRELKRPSSENLVGSVTTEAYSCIRLSYNHLETDELKSTFLLCSTMGFTSDASIEKLLRYGMGLNLFKTVYTMEEARDKVNTLVQELKNSSLLLETSDNERFSIHDVVRDSLSLKDLPKLRSFCCEAEEASKSDPERQIVDTLMPLFDGKLQHLDIRNCTARDNGEYAKLSHFGLALQMVMQLRNTLKQVLYTLTAMFMDLDKSEQSSVKIFTLQDKFFEQGSPQQRKELADKLVGQMLPLSLQMYGCRVIQKHCSNQLQCQCIADEILESACALAQDQYGNYVTQHVLERGQPHERSQIISKLTGKIVQMSQHKYASNVVEKCLEYCNTAERELLIEEIIGQTEENDNLLSMMKDQFANYVVQKILERCSDKQREVLINRIRVHCNALKKYSYGKHIVARFEQLYGEESQGSDASDA
ncbi:hypothetical protein LWI29_011077 [Acer saccharum]|uniref:PUM-HD domain-containing protein n=1 Tax=Acer saccharum TaxID=4024 RepID=A0AA39SV43_ACESA|nr:hypothetical protein LWI29_011077 [Acer saccharum]